MSYESMQTTSAIVGLFVFIGLFIAVLVFVFWPGNQKGFKEASRIPLEKDDEKSGGSNGR